MSGSTSLPAVPKHSFLKVFVSKYHLKQAFVWNCHLWLSYIVCLRPDFWHGIVGLGPLAALQHKVRQFRKHTNSKTCFDNKVCVAQKPSVLRKEWPERRMGWGTFTALLVFGAKYEQTTNGRLPNENNAKKMLEFNSRCIYLSPSVAMFCIRMAAWQTMREGAFWTRFNGMFLFAFGGEPCS